MKGPLFFFVLVVLGLAWWMSEQRPADGIESFDACARAGYPILESFPRQCTTPDGRTFTEEAVSGVCRYPPDCGPNFYCKHGVCTELEPDVHCRSDDECQLMNAELGLGCCWAGACQIIDYSEEKWVGVNLYWLVQMRQTFCPMEEDCGPAPMCAVRSINENYEARCVQGRCQKVPLP